MNKEDQKYYCLIAARESAAEMCRTYIDGKRMGNMRNLRKAQEELDEYRTQRFAVQDKNIDNPQKYYNHMENLVRKEREEKQCQQ